AGWNVRYTTELTDAPWFYLRGEEYSAQLDAFVRRIEAGEVTGLNDFASATITDEVIAMISEDAAHEESRVASASGADAMATAARTAGSRGRLAAAWSALRGGK